MDGSFTVVGSVVVVVVVVVGVVSDMLSAVSLLALGYMVEPEFIVLS